MKNEKYEIDRLKFLLENKGKEIEGLKEEIAGKDEIICILEAMILECVCEKGKIEISKEKVAEGLKRGFRFELTKDKYILMREE